MPWLQRSAPVSPAGMPGLRLSMESLSGNTSQLPRVSLDAPAKCIGTNTVACMQSGAIYGSAALLDGMIERMEALFCSGALVFMLFFRCGSFPRAPQGR